MEGLVLTWGTFGHKQVYYKLVLLYLILIFCLREALKVLSTLLNAAGYLLISSAKVIRRVIQGADFLEAQQSKSVANMEYWH